MSFPSGGGADLGHPGRLQRPWRRRPPRYRHGGQLGRWPERAPGPGRRHLPAAADYRPGPIRLGGGGRRLQRRRMARCRGDPSRHEQRLRLPQRPELAPTDRPVDHHRRRDGHRGEHGHRERHLHGAPLGRLQPAGHGPGLNGRRHGRRRQRLPGGLADVDLRPRPDDQHRPRVGQRRPARRVRRVLLRPPVRIDQRLPRGRDRHRHDPRRRAVPPHRRLRRHGRERRDEGLHLHGDAVGRLRCPRVGRLLDRRPHRGGAILVRALGHRRRRLCGHVRHADLRRRPDQQDHHRARQRRPDRRGERVIPGQPRQRHLRATHLQPGPRDHPG